MNDFFHSHALEPTPGRHITARPAANKSLSLEQRKEVFLALVEAQDNKMTVPQSLKATAERFLLSEQQVRQIEQEGLTGEWPPLG
jgi:hypothetical protein